MHILVDLFLWFSGVELLWPVPFELNFWSWFTTPAWLKILLDTGEFLAFGLYFFLLGSLAVRHGTDADRQRASITWTYIELGLFILFTAIFFHHGIQMFAIPGLWRVVPAVIDRWDGDNDTDETVSRNDLDKLSGGLRVALFL